MKARVSEYGFTLIESIFTIAIIAIAMTGLIAVWAKSVSHSADPFWQSQTAALGKVYLSQINQLPTSKIKSYQGKANDLTGQKITGYDGFEVHVEVQNAGSDFALKPAALKKITLTVKAPQGDKQLFVLYKHLSKAKQ